MQNDATMFDGGNPLYSDEQLDIMKNHEDLEMFPDNNWNDLVLKNFAGQHRHNLSLTGGDKKTSYFVSVGFLNQEGLLKANSDELQRYNLRSNVTSVITSYSIHYTKLYDQASSMLKLVDNSGKPP